MVDGPSCIARTHAHIPFMNQSISNSNNNIQQVLSYLQHAQFTTLCYEYSQCQVFLEFQVKNCALDNLPFHPNSTLLQHMPEPSSATSMPVHSFPQRQSPTPTQSTIPLGSGANTLHFDALILCTSLSSSYNHTSVPLATQEPTCGNQFTFIQMSMLPIFLVPIIRNNNKTILIVS